MMILRFLFHTIAITLLTILTQVGGIAYLLSFISDQYTDKWTAKPNLQRVYRFTGFLLIYCIISFLIVPPVAKMNGRIPMPIIKTSYVEPVSMVTCFTNRHYVRPSLRNICFEAGKKLHEKHPEATIKYMDGNFPLINKFPLLPHISHNDGKKLDIAFCYTDNKSGDQTSDYPPHIAYGVCEGPKSGEYDRPAECDKTHWMYSFMHRNMPKGNRVRFGLDENSTRFMINLFVKHPEIGKVLLEPHLETRLGLNSDKVRSVQCGSARHDDHIHIQIR
jgi:hypothetical protein